MWSSSSPSLLALSHYNNASTNLWDGQQTFPLWWNYSDNKTFISLVSFADPHGCLNKCAKLVQQDAKLKKTILWYKNIFITKTIILSINSFTQWAIDFCSSNKCNINLHNFTIIYLPTFSVLQYGSVFLHIYKNGIYLYFYRKTMKIKRTNCCWRYI